MPAKKTPAAKRKGGAKTNAPPPKRREIGALVCLFLAVFSFIGLFSGEGWFIDFFRVFMRGIIGPGFYLMTPVLLYGAFVLAFHRGRPVKMRLICLFLVPLCFSMLMHLLLCLYEYGWQLSMLGSLYVDGLNSGSAQSGGAIGGFLALLFRALFGKAGAAVVFICCMIFLLLAALNITLAHIVDWYKNRTVREYEPEPEPERPVRGKVQSPKKNLFDAEAPNSNANKPKAKPKPTEPIKVNSAIDIPVDDPKPTYSERQAEEPVFSVEAEPELPKSEPAYSEPIPNVVKPLNETAFTTSEKQTPKVAREETERARAEVAETIEKTLLDSEPVDYVYPPADLLTALAPGSMVDGREEMSLNAARLEATIKSFGISASICGITRGPSVTRYEVELEQGIKLNKLTNLADDIALSLGATGVRIAPIPDKISIVGIEVPNKLVNIVCLREIIESAEFKNNASKLSFAIGKDIGGNPVVGDIAKLPHLLIAGTTGSGKSVCMNSLILSLLYKASPDEVRLIMIDPKMIEMGAYNGIPHLLIPVVTDPKKAAGALQWAVFEMMKRYKLFLEANARDLASYNQAVSKTEDGVKLPQIVVLIDELADLMLVAAKEVEESICRVAQMGRASGIHIVIATQRPSADVITGLMKANIPSRIAFAVDSSLNSRIILDTTGAEKLVGKGDMLYAPIGIGKPQRVQGTFVTDSEREEVIEFIKERGSVQYSAEIIKEIEKAAESKDSPAIDRDDADEVDELFTSAVDITLEMGQASTSMLQRRLKLGYSRAARLIDQMERQGIVGPYEGSKPRQLLITKQQWREMQGISSDDVQDLPEDEEGGE